MTCTRSSSPNRPTPTARSSPTRSGSRRTTNGSSPPRPTKGRFAYLGFTGVWYPAWYDAEYNATKVYTITDRPVYRPDQKVRYKFWIRHAKYDMEDGTQFANRQFTIEVHNPKREKVATDREDD